MHSKVSYSSALQKGKTLKQIINIRKYIKGIPRKLSIILALLTLLQYILLSPENKYTTSIQILILFSSGLYQRLFFLSTSPTH